MKRDVRDKHTFVICAYKESQFLEKCILSLKNQSVKSNILIVTSTPNLYIDKIAEKHGIEVRVNTGEGGIVQDWNFGYAQCITPYITIAHQDDIYFEDYAMEAIKQIEAAKRPLIFFSDYCEVRNGKNVYKNKLLKVKRILLLPLRIKSFQRSKFVRRRVLSMGSAICCPAVTFVKENLMNPVFTVGYRSCEDWEAWERISKLKGEFVYCSEVLMGHRIHEGSETSNILADNARVKEDYEMFCKFWPRTIAKILVKFYSNSEKSNVL